MLWLLAQLFEPAPEAAAQAVELSSALIKRADLTCDSDGKFARFINSGSEKPLLELHSLKQGEQYWIGLFLAGAYQEVMGNLHNLFGSTNAVNIRLGAGSTYQVEHVVRGKTNAEVLKAMEHLEQSLQQSTYLEADYQGEPIN